MRGASWPSINLPFLLEILKLLESFHLWVNPHFLPDIPNLVSFVNMVSSCNIPYDPWIVPEVSNVDTFDDYMSFSPIEPKYEVIYLECLTHSDIHSLINWVDHSQDFDSSSNPFASTLPTDERIMKIMM